MDFLRVLSLFGIMGSPEPADITVRTALESLYEHCKYLGTIDEENKVSEDFINLLANDSRALIEQCDTKACITPSALRNIKKQAAARLCLGDETSLHALPEVFNRLTKEDLSRIFYIDLNGDTAIDHQGRTELYGHWIASFARSITVLFEEKTPLTSYNIKILAQSLFAQLEYHKNIEARSLEYSHLCNLVKEAELKHLHILTGCHLNRFPSFQSIVFNREQDKYELADGSFEVLQALIRENERAVVIHFIATYPHEFKEQALLLSVVKRPFKRPFMIVLDIEDKNLPLSGNDKYITLVYENLIKPFYPKRGS
jgi:hypothetical protein